MADQKLPPMPKSYSSGRDKQEAKKKTFLVWQHQRLFVHWQKPFLLNDPAPLIQESEKGKTIGPISSLDAVELGTYVWFDDNWKSVQLPDGDKSGWVYSSSASGKFGKKKRTSLFRKRMLQRIATKSRSGLQRKKKGSHAHNSDAIRHLLHSSTFALLDTDGPETGLLDFIAYEIHEMTTAGWKPSRWVNGEGQPCKLHDIDLEMEDQDGGTWGWAEPWKIYTDEFTDGEGFIYARTITELDHLAKDPYKTKCAFRRRKWVRTAVFELDGCKRNLVTQIMARLLGQLLWHAFISGEETAFIGPNKMYSVADFDPYDEEFDAKVFMCEEGRTPALQSFSERFGILTFDPGEQFFGGERNRRRLVIDGAQCVHKLRINGLYVRTLDCRGPERKHDVYKKRNEEMYLWFDGATNMWVLSDQMDGGQVYAYVESENELSCGIKKPWVVLMHPKDPKLRITRLPEKVTPTKTCVFERQPTLRVVSHDVMNVFKKFEQKFDTTWNHEKVAVQAFNLLAQRLSHLINQAAFRDHLSGPYSSKERDSFIESVCDIALLYSHVIKYDETEIEVQGLALIACLLDAVQLAENHGRKSEFATATEELEYLVDKADMPLDDFMSRALFSPQILEVCGNLLQLLLKHPTPDDTSHFSNEERKLMDDSLIKIRTIVIAYLAEYHDREISPTTLIEILVCFHKCKKLYDKKYYSSHNFRAEVEQHIYNSAEKHYRLMKTEIPFKLLEGRFFQNSVNFKANFDTFVVGIKDLINREIFDITLPLWKMGVFGDVFPMFGVRSILEKFSADVAFPIVSQDLCTFKQFHLTLIEAVCQVIDTVNDALKRLPEGVRFENETDHNPIYLFPWWEKVINNVMEQIEKDSVKKLEKACKKHVTNPENWADRHGKNFLYSECLIPIFTILNIELKTYFELLSKFPPKAADQHTKYFAGVRNVILKMCSAIRDSCISMSKQMLDRHNVRFESEGWFQIQEEEAVDVHAKRRSREEFLEHLKGDCCRLMSLVEIEENKIRELQKQIIQHIRKLNKSATLRKSLLDSCRSIIESMKGGVAESRERLLEILALELVQVQCEGELKHLYTHQNKYECNLVQTDVWKLMEDALCLAQERLDRETYMSFAEHLQSTLDEAMYHVLTNADSKCMFTLQDKQPLRADYREFIDFFNHEDWNLGQVDRRWKEVLELCMLSTKELIESANKARNQQLTEPLSLVNASRQLNTNHPTFAVLCHRDDAEARRFVQRYRRKRSSMKREHVLHLGRGTSHRAASPVQKEISPTYRFVLKIHQCCDIKAADSNGYSDPYIIATCFDETKKSKVKKKTLNPRFDFEARWRVREGYFDTAGKQICVDLQLFDWNLVMKHKQIGSFHLRLREDESLDHEWKRWKLPNGKEDLSGRYGRIQMSASLQKVVTE